LLFALKEKYAQGGKACQNPGWQFIDLNRDGKLDRAEWEKYRALMTSENALLAYSVAESGFPVANSCGNTSAQFPSYLRSWFTQGVLYMISTPES